MTLEAIRTIAELEEKNRTDKAEAEARIKRALAEVDREGEAQLQKTRENAAEKGKALLRKAEARAADAAAEISAQAERESQILRAAAEKHLDEAAEFIVGRVVKS